MSFSSRPADPARVRILLVEDDVDDVWIIQNLLADRWDGPFELVQVELLSAAIERCAADQFDIILLDLALPDSRGLDTFFAIHAAARRVPIVVLTGWNDEATAIQAVQAGAQDYLVKGQVDDNLLVRSIRYAIERSRRHQAEETLRRTAQEFLAAQEIQQRLFPAQPPRVPGLDIAGALYPAEEAAGDYYDYFPMLGEGTAVVVGDVSGHGMGSALLMAETRACLRTLALVHAEVGEILTRANRLLAADTRDLHFVTVFLARFDSSARLLAYAGAGQRGYLLDPAGRTIVLESTGLPLGVSEEALIPAASPLALERGQVFAFFTDGLTEAESPGHARFGAARAMELIRTERNNSAQGIVEALYDELRGFTRQQPLRDDVTMVIVKVDA
jgi:serine phosphatase RsbU (regulator of sigma subunit)